jgi:hypothetical protein
MNPWRQVHEIWHEDRSYTYLQIKYKTLSLINNYKHSYTVAMQSFEVTSDEFNLYSNYVHLSKKLFKHIKQNNNY